MKYCLMFVVVGASMHASEIQRKPYAKELLKSELVYPLLEPSAPEADELQLSSLIECSRISRPSSPSISMASQSVASIKVVPQEESKAQSSMPSVQPVSTEAKEILYPLSDEIKRKAQRLALEAKIKADASTLYAYVLKNPSVIKKQILAHEPQLHDHYVQLYVKYVQGRSIEMISRSLIAHYDPNNKWFTTQKEQNEFAPIVESYIKNNKKNESKISADLAHIIEKNSFLGANEKMWIETRARLDEAATTIRNQLAAIVQDHPDELENLCKEEHTKQAYNICKESLSKYVPNDPALNNEDTFKKWFDEYYSNFAIHLAAKNAFEATKKAQEEKVREINRKAGEANKRAEEEERVGNEKCRALKADAAKKASKGTKCVIL